MSTVFKHLDMESLKESLDYEGGIMELMNYGVHDLPEGFDEDFRRLWEEADVQSSELQATLDKISEFIYGPGSR